jgi:glycyl-tRNA synthetase beta chain
MKPLLIEIGTEEIPSGYIMPALKAFCAGLTARLTDLRIDCGPARVYGTPRRLAVYVQDVAERQQTITSELMGPPERVAFDENRQPTVAARKFAEKAGVSIDALAVKETEKGRYLCVRKTERGRATPEVLREVLAEIIASIPFPKTMRWADLRVAFARPVHSLVVLFGERAVSVSFAGVKSGRHTFGHRFMRPGKIRLTSAGDYLDVLADAYVLADMDQRRSVMEDRMARAVKAVGGRILEDADLVEENTHLVEYPEVVLGQFAQKFLELPREVMVTAMREHQRYFAVIDDQGAIMPYFIAVNNNWARDMKVVAAGHERVLRARLEDARFFFHADLKTSPENRVERLKSVIFQAELGSVYDKTGRIRRLGGRLGRSLGLDEKSRAYVDRAAFLCKADLVSHVVNEFPKLQGVMGRIYALRVGEPEQVAEAIEQHYQPTSSGGRLPSAMTGAVLSIADKTDTICGCFYLGLVPTGTSDPYALRRQAIGIIQIALDKDLAFSTSALVREAMEMLGAAGAELEAKTAEVCRFLENRMAYLLEDGNIARDLAAAVISVSADRITDVWQRAAALQRMKSAPDFESLAAAFKRVVNIIRKADSADTADSEVRVQQFADPAETALYEAFSEVEKNVSELLAQKDMDAAFGQIAGLKPGVDAFFDSVLVMDEDPKVRRNRLALLQRISELFARLADFSKIST